MRLVPSLRWSKEKIGIITGVPMDFKTKDYDIIEEEVSPHTHPEDVEDPEAHEQIGRAHV